MNKKWMVLGGIVFLFLLSFLPFPKFHFGPQIGVINISEAIMASEEIVEELNDFAEREDIDAILIRLNTPGGGVAASQEIYEKVKEISEANIKPIIASMGSVAASGGYYIAAGADTIIANKGTATGSIGVIMSYPIAADLLDKVGLAFQSVKSGALKDAGNFARKPTKADLSYFQDLVDNLHTQFVRTVAYERGMSYDEAATLATGQVYSGEQALRLGLVDIIGTYDNAIRLVTKLAGFDEKPTLIYPKVEDEGIIDILLNSKQINLPFSNLGIFPLPEYSLYYGGGN
ncbi:MAG: signal peptide peptidase SppA [Candidatus Marinimicrobia bacterium]|jgi:protease-4|nr:signal peptide peptidase SppA [Candidatus Neomarinimicrobiota bacterium]MBT6871362.1 signal peptide peptidase SppA [Candidatus Neomarinimicrobiota bacterium]